LQHNNKFCLWLTYTSTDLCLVIHPMFSNVWFRFITELY
jgi:hypothetical protein